MPDTQKCDGCDAVGKRLTLFTNDKHYCSRCAEEIRALWPDLRPAGEASS